MQLSHHDRLKLEAKKLKKANGWSHAEALNFIAEREGFSSWEMLKHNMPTAPTIVAVAPYWWNIDDHRLSFDWGSFAKQFAPGIAENAFQQIVRVFEANFHGGDYSTPQFLVVVDPDQDFWPSAISPTQREQALQYIDSLPEGYRESFRFGFENAGNLNIDMNWDGTPEHDGQEYHVSLFNEAYASVLEGLKSNAIRAVSIEIERIFSV